MISFIQIILSKIQEIVILQTISYPFKFSLILKQIIVDDNFIVSD